eukprot:3806239-Pleurochrysis_carterae.AAC.1
MGHHSTSRILALRSSSSRQGATRRAKERGFARFLESFCARFVEAVFARFLRPFRALLGGVFPRVLEAAGWAGGLEIGASVEAWVSGRLHWAREEVREEVCQGAEWAGRQAGGQPSRGASNGGLRECDCYCAEDRGLCMVSQMLTSSIAGEAAALRWHRHVSLHEIMHDFLNANAARQLIQQLEIFDPKLSQPKKLIYGVNELEWVAGELWGAPAD